MTEECVETGNPALTLSSPLVQEYDAVTFSGSTTFFQTPGAPEVNHSFFFVDFHLLTYP
jgi:hypothetical protein